MPLYVVNLNDEKKFFDFISTIFGSNVIEIKYENAIDPNFEISQNCDGVWFRFPESDSELARLTQITRAWVQEQSGKSAYGIGQHSRLREPRLAGTTSSWYLSCQEWKSTSKK